MIWRALRTALPLLAILAFAPACASHGSAKAFRPTRLDSESGWLAVRDVPVIRQTTPTNCGAASMSMLLGYWGSPASIEEVEGALPALEAGGFRAGDLRDLARARGLNAFIVAGELRDLASQLEKNRPVLVGLIKRTSLTRGVPHYELVVGYDVEKQRVLLLDPAHGWREDTVAGFLAEWDATSRVTLLVFR